MNSLCICGVDSVPYPRTHAHTSFLFCLGLSVIVCEVCVLTTRLWFLCILLSAAVTAGLHMSDSHDPNVRQARVHFPRTCTWVCGVECMHIVSSGAQTYGQGAGGWGVCLKRGWTKLKIPPGNFIYTREEREREKECVNNMFCYSDLLKWLKAGAKNKAVDLWGLVSRRARLSVPDHVQHNDTTAGQ